MPSMFRGSRPDWTLVSRLPEIFHRSAPCEMRPGSFRPSRFTYLRSLVAGIAAALAASFAYLLFAATTGLPSGYLSLGAGLLIAKAVKTSARGQSGRKFQLTAALLTYLVVAIVTVPVAAISSPSPAASAPAVSTAPIGVAFSAHLAETAALTMEPRIAEQLMASLLSPFLQLRNPVRGAIDLVILFAGLSIAWRKSTVTPKGYGSTAIEVSRIRGKEF